MPEEPQFHMTLVTQKRVRRDDPSLGANVSGAKSLQTEAHHAHSDDAHRHSDSAQHHSDGARHSDDAHRHSDSAQHHSDGTRHSDGAHHSDGARRHSTGSSEHRRHYKDYGTVDLGSLTDDRPVRRDPVSAPAAPTRGENQREFYNRYDAVLSRRYSTRNKTKTARIAMIFLLIALVIVASFVLLKGMAEQTADTLPKPQIETIPVASLDLGG